MASLLWLLLIVLAGGSYAVWWRVARQLKSGLEPVPRREVDGALPPVWQRALVLVGVLATWLTLPRLIAGQFGLLDPEVREAGPSLDQVIASCAWNAGTVLLVPLLLLEAGGYRRQALGFQLADWPGQVFDGVRGFFASVLPVFAVMLMTLPFRRAETQHEFLKLLADDPTFRTVGWIAVAVTVFAPLAEELVFRVALQGTLSTVLPKWIVIPGVAVLFGAVHGWPDALPLVPLALILGYVYEQRRSYLAIVLVHALFNASNLLLALAAARSGVTEPPGAGFLR